VGQDRSTASTTRTHAAVLAGIPQLGPVELQPVQNGTAQPESIGNTHSQAGKLGPTTTLGSGRRLGMGLLRWFHPLRTSRMEEEDRGELTAPLLKGPERGSGPLVVEGARLTVAVARMHRRALRVNRSAVGTWRRTGAIAMPDRSNASATNKARSLLARAPRRPRGPGDPSGRGASQSPRTRRGTSRSSARVSGVGRPPSCRRRPRDGTRD
jgi:hypothetical protein